MTTQRIFGAIKGAGSQVRERQPSKPIEQGPYGTTVIVGAFRSGPTKAHPGPNGHRVIGLVSGEPQYRRVNGGLTQDSEAPIACEHFYEKSRGAGQLWTLRVTDGSEVQAKIPVYNRDVEKSYSFLFPNAKIAAKVAEYRAQNGGRWGGRRNVAAYLVADMAVAIASNTTIDLGLAVDSLLDDQFVGAEISFPSVDATNTFKITGHTDAGLFTIEGQWSDAVLASTATNTGMSIRLENVHELTGDLETLAIEIGDSGEDTTKKFSIYAHRDGVSVASWENLGLEAGSDSYWVDALAGDGSNYELDYSSARDLFSGDPNAALQRPANWAGIAKTNGIATSTPNVINLQIVHWQYVGTGDAYLESTAFTGNEVPCTITCTFTSATDYDVSIAFEDGQSFSGFSSSIGALVPAATGLFPAFRIRGLSVAPVAGDKLTIICRPLPKNLKDKGGFIYIAASPDEGDVRKRYRITDNTVDSVTVSSAVDLSAEITVPTYPSSEGTADENHTLTGGETFVFDAGDGAGNVTLTSTLGAGSFTSQQIVDEFNSLADSNYSPNLKYIEFYILPSNSARLGVRLVADAGASASWDIQGATSTLNAIVGLPTTNVSITSGADGQICRLQYRQEMGGGYDGLANISNADYIEALDTDPNDGALSRMLPLNTGLIAIAAPGVSAAAVQTAVMAWAYAHNGIAAVEIPDTVTTVAGAISHHETNLAVGASQDYHFCPFPSYGKIVNPYGKGLYTTSLLGAILGFHARQATDAQGYHLAPAGIDASLSPLVKDLTTGDAVLSNEALNGYGLIEVRKVGANIYLWGDRIPGNGSRPFLHKRKSVSHIGRVLLTNTAQLVFKPINNFTFAEANRDVRALMLPWQISGWFDDSDGPGFEDQVDIKVDETNNPIEERNAGNLYIDVGFNIVNTSERVIFSIGPKGVTETA